MAIFRGVEPDPALEGAGEGHAIGEAKKLGDDVELVRGGLEEVAGALHADIGDVLHGAASEFPKAALAQGFGAGVNMSG